MQRRNVTRDNTANMTKIREHQLHRATADTKQLMLKIRVAKHILAFVVMQIQPATEPMALRRAQNWF